MAFVTVIASLISIAATVFLCIKVLPAKYDGTFKKKPAQFLHDYFNFKNLYLESVLKVIFTFASVACVAVGLLGATIGNIINIISNIFDAIKFGYFPSWIWNQFFSYLFGGILLAILGPVVLRLAYELILMFILLVKNVIEINKKLKAPEAAHVEEEVPATEAPAAEVTPAEAATATEEAPATEEVASEETPAE